MPLFQSALMELRWAPDPRAVIARYAAVCTAPYPVPKASAARMTTRGLAREASAISPTNVTAIPPSSTRRPGRRSPRTPARRQGDRRKRDDGAEAAAHQHESDEEEKQARPAERGEGVGRGSLRWRGAGGQLEDEKRPRQPYHESDQCVGVDAPGIEEGDRYGGQHDARHAQRESEVADRAPAPFGRGELPYERD